MLIGELIRAMLLRLFDDMGEIRDSTNKNSHHHRDANVAAKKAREEEEERRLKGELPEEDVDMVDQAEAQIQKEDEARE
jgi:hypothetical protein